MRYRITIEEIDEEFSPATHGQQLLNPSLAFREVYRRTVPDLDMDALIIAVDGLDKVQE